MNYLLLINVIIKLDVIIILDGSKVIMCILCVTTSTDYVYVWGYVILV